MTIADQILAAVAGRETFRRAELSDIVIGLERNGQADDEVERNTTKIRVLKNRFSGLTGPAGAALYYRDTGRMLEIDEEVI